MKSNGYYIKLIDNEKVLKEFLKQIDDGDYFTVPTMKGLCLYLGVTRKTLYEWKKNKSKNR